jgi:hypothetical protein
MLTARPRDGIEPIGRNPAQHPDNTGIQPGRLRVVSPDRRKLGSAHISPNWVARRSRWFDAVGTETRFATRRARHDRLGTKPSSEFMSSGRHGRRAARARVACAGSAALSARAFVRSTPRTPHKYVYGPSCLTAARGTFGPMSQRRPYSARHSHCRAIPEVPQQRPG